MSKSVRVWFPTYIGDFFSLTASMAGHEVGAFQLLIAHLWKNGGAIKADDRQLAKLAKATPKQWQDIKETLWPLFEIKGGMLTHPETTQEIEKAKANQDKKRQAGIASGASRRGTSAEQVFNTRSTGDEPRADDGGGIGTNHPLPEKVSDRGISNTRDGLRVLDGGK